MIYFLQLSTGAIKIGFTDNLESRLYQLGLHYGHEPALLATMDGDRSTERELHERFAEHRYGRTEQFRPVPEILGFIGKPLLVTANMNTVQVLRVTPPVTLKASPEWKEWIENVAKFCRLDVAKLIDRAVIDYAKAEGFPGEAPSR